MGYPFIITFKVIYSHVLTIQVSYSLQPKKYSLSLDNFSKHSLQ